MNKNKYDIGAPIKISIVIPSYNQGQFIEQTINSILYQEYPNFEIIVIDGGSTDNTIDILKKYEDKLSYWTSERDRGQAHAINKGFKRCSGEIMGWINSDDYYLPNYFFKVVSAFKDKNIDAVYANSITLDSDTNIEYPTYSNYYINRYRFLGGILPSHTAFWKKDIHVELDERLICALDQDLWIRLLDKRLVRHLNVFGGVFRLHRESKTVQFEKKYTEQWQKDYRLIEYKYNIPKYSKINMLYYIYFNLAYKFFCKALAPKNNRNMAISKFLEEKRN